MMTKKLQTLVNFPIFFFLLSCVMHVSDQSTDKFCRIYWIRVMGDGVNIVVTINLSNKTFNAPSFGCQYNKNCGILYQAGCMPFFYLSYLSPSPLSLSLSPLSLSFSSRLSPSPPSISTYPSFFIYFTVSFFDSLYRLSSFCSRLLYLAECHLSLSLSGVFPVLFLSIFLLSCSC